MMFSQRDNFPDSPISRLLRWCPRWVEERRRRAASSCLRCGRPGSVSCHACKALVCDRCWVPSIETGSALPLCVDCIAPQRGIGYAGIGANTAEVFRSGARLLLAGVGGLVLYGYSRAGWAGGWRAVAMLFQPAVILGLVPMAFLLGAMQRGAAMLVRSALRASGSSR